MAYMGHVDAYLMGTSCFKHTFDKRYMTEFLDSLIVRHRMLAGWIIRRQNRHFQPVSGITPYISLYTSESRSGASPHKGVVFPLGGLVEKLASEVCLGIRRLGHYQQPGSVLVNSMYKTETRIVYVIVRGIAKMPCKRVDESARIVPMAGMYDKSGRFVDNKHRVILINYIKRDILGYNFKLVFRAIHDHLNHVIRLDTVIRLDSLAVDKYTTGLRSLLDTVSR